MLKIAITQFDENSFEITVLGHAGIAEIGKDILCAGISTLYETLTTSILDLSRAMIVSESKADGFRSIQITNIDDTALALIQSFVIGCRGLEAAYPKNLKVVA